MLNRNHVLNYLYQFHEPYINFPFVFYRLAISILFKNTEFQLQFFFSFIKFSRVPATGQEELSFISIQPLNRFKNNYKAPQRTTDYEIHLSYLILSHFFQDPL